MPSELADPQAAPADKPFADYDQLVQSAAPSQSPSDFSDYDNLVSGTTDSPFSDYDSVVSDGLPESTKASAEMDSFDAKLLATLDQRIGAAGGSNKPVEPPSPIDLFAYQTADKTNRALQGLFRMMGDAQSGFESGTEITPDETKSTLYDIADSLEQYRTDKLLPSFGVSESDLNTTAGKVTGAVANVFDVAPGPAIMISKMAAETYRDGFEEARQRAAESGVTDREQLDAAGRTGARKAVFESAPILLLYTLGGKASGKLVEKIAPNMNKAGRAALGAAASAISNMAVSAGTRLVQGGKLVGDLRQNLTDILFGLTGAKEAITGADRTKIQIRSTQPISNPETRPEVHFGPDQTAAIEKENSDALRQPGTTTEIPRPAGTGENIQGDSGGVRPGEQGDEPSGEVIQQQPEEGERPPPQVETVPTQSQPVGTPTAEVPAAEPAQPELSETGFDYDAWQKAKEKADAERADAERIQRQEQAILFEYRPGVEGFGPGAASIKEPVAKYKVRKFAERIQQSQELVQSLKDAIGNRFYEPIPNKVTTANAVALVNERGIPESINILKAEGNGIPPEVRSVMGQFIVKRLNEGIRALEPTRPQDAEILRNVAADLAEWQQEYGTRLGRGVQSFAIFDRLDPQGKLRDVIRKVRKVRDKFTQTEGGNVTDIVDTAQGRSDEARGETPKEGKGRRPKRGEEEEPTDKDQADKIDAMVKREQDKIARHLSDTPTWDKLKPKRKNEILALIRAHLKQEQEAFVDRMIDFGVDKDLSESIDRMAGDNRRRIDAIKMAKRLQSRAGQFDRIAHDIARQLSDTPDFGPKGVPDPARALIRAHLSKPQPDFIRRMVEFGATSETANVLDRLAFENRERILKVDRAKRAEQLRRMFGALDKNKLAAKLRKPEWEKIVELADHGLLTDQTFMDAAGERLGLPVLTAENRNEILRLAGKIEAAPEGMPRDEALFKLGKYIANIKRFDSKDLGLGIYYGNMLSGYNTHIVNALDTFLNVTSEVNGLALINPRAAAHIYSGLLRGFDAGRMDFLLALTEGRNLTEGRYLEVPHLMEIAKFGESGGVPVKTDSAVGRIAKAVAESKPATILNGWKYVSRLMSASDSVMFHGAKEARAALLAWRAAHNEGLRGKALDDRVNALLGLDEQSAEEFKTQAEAEGFTGAKARARQVELREQARPEEANADANDFAGEATYNHEPHGVLGFFSNKAGEITSELPAGKLVVPFSRIVANVTNRGLNYSPIGFARAYRGYWREEAPVGDARAQMLARATLGTAGLTTLGLLAASGVITIHGAGPSDANRRHQLENAKWKPYSIQIGNTYLTYVYTPIGLGLSVLGNVMDSYRYNELSQKDALTRGIYAFSRLGSTVFSQSFLSGLSGLFRMLSGAPGDVIGAGKSFFASTFATVTTPKIITDIQRLFDPTLYESTSLMGDLLRNTPFAAAIDRPTLNAFGEPVIRSTNRFMSIGSDDPAWRFVIDHGLRVPVPDKYTQIKEADGTKRRITPDEYYDYMRESGRRVKQLILEKQFDWGQLSQDEAQRQLSKESEKVRRQVKIELFSNPD